MKRCQKNQLITATFLIFWAAVSSCSGNAATPSKVGGSTSEFAQWSRSLRQLGATPEEVEQFEASLRRQSLVGASAWQDYLRNVPPSFFAHYLQMMRWW